MRELLLGIVVVGLVIGIWVGRQTERARRTYKDWDAAKVALKKGRTVAFTEIRRAATIVIVVGGLLLAAFLGMMNAPH
jgi:hypothetical protein